MLTQVNDYSRYATVRAPIEAPAELAFPKGGLLGTQFTCVTSTKVPILTQKGRLGEIVLRVTVLSRSALMGAKDEMHLRRAKASTARMLTYADVC
jgi:hypothetical protein